MVLIWISLLSRARPVAQVHPCGEQIAEVDEGRKADRIKLLHVAVQRLVHLRRGEE
jgi:hypothetical protein